MSLLSGLVAAVMVVCPSAPGAKVGSVAAGSDRERLVFLANTLQHEAQKDALWHGLWRAGYTGLVVGQALISLSAPLEERVEWYVGIGASLVGLTFSAVNRLEVLTQGEPFARAAAHVSDDGVCALVLEGERLLRTDALTERAHHAWFIHVLTGAFNVGVALLLGLGFGRWRAAITDFVAGEVIGTTNLLTRPDALGAALEHYLGDSSRPVTSFAVTPSFSDKGWSLSLGVSF